MKPTLEILEARDCLSGVPATANLMAALQTAFAPTIALAGCASLRP